MKAPSNIPWILLSLVGVLVNGAGFYCRPDPFFAAGAILDAFTAGYFLKGEVGND